jgi:flagella basal body P-ring formation protein FlgA
MRLNFPFLVFCAYGIIQPASASQASPNSMVTLTSQVIRVADLFTNAGPEASDVLGASPAPGGHIVVGSDQLAAIAAAYQVPWQPDGSNPQVVLASPGIALDPALITAAIANAVAISNGPVDAAITLPDFAPPMVPPGASPAITVNQINFDPVTDNFSAAVEITAAGMAPQTLNLSGLAEPSIEALVATHNLMPGEILSAADVTLARIPSHQAANAIITPAAIIGMATNINLATGEAITQSELTAPIVVRKGAFVVLSLAVPGLIVTAQGVALAAGGQGDLITVLNPASHAVVQAIVTGPNAASILPGSSPLTTAQNAGGYASYASYAQTHVNAFQPEVGQP